MTKGAVNYSIRVFIQKGLGLFFFLVGTRWVLTWQSIVYFGLLFLATAVSLVVMFRVNPTILAERGKIVTDSPKWDKVILMLYWLLHFFVIHYVAGLEMKNQLAETGLFWLGIALGLFSAAISLGALVVNTYLESTARVQEDRDQTVISTGVYSIVRHPTYSAVLLSCLGIFLVFPKPFVLLTASVIAILMVIRTNLEDQLLERSLKGYEEYQKKTRYKLIPFIW